MADIRPISLCSLAMIVTPQYVRDASGSVLFPDRLLHKLHGRGLAKSTICWITLSLSLSPSSFHLSLLPLFSLVCLFSLLYYKCGSNSTAIPRLFTKQVTFCWLEQRAQLRQVITLFFSPFPFFLFFFLQSICYQRSLGMQQSLVRGPAFFPISRMI